MKLRWIAALAAIACWCVMTCFAPTAQAQQDRGAGAPSGTCPGSSGALAYLDTTNHVVYVCSNGVWVNAGALPNPTGGGSGGGITQVATLPATCTVGTSVFLTTSGTHQPVGQYNCVATNVFAFVGTNTGLVFNVADFGVTNAGNEACDATFTNGSGVVTTSANDPAFTSSMAGWSAQGSSTCLDAPSYLNVMLRGTITFNSAHQITVSTNANVNAAGTATQHLVYGPIEDTQLTAAENAAWNYATGGGSAGGICYNLNLSAGFTFVLVGHFNTLNCNTQSTGSASRGAHIFGQGAVASRLMMGTDFDYTTCPTYSTINTCFGAVNGLRKERLGITGGQQPGTNPAAGTCLINDGTDSFSVDVDILGIGPALTNLSGACMFGLGTTDRTVIVDGAGTTGINVSLNAGGHGVCEFCVAGNNGTPSISLKVAGGSFVTMGGGWGGGTASNGIVSVSANTLWTSIGEVIFNPVAGSNFISCAGTCNIVGMNDFGTITGNMGNLTGAGHIMVQGSVLSSGTTNKMWNLTNAAALGDDLGGNTFTDTAGQVVALTAGASLRRIVPTSVYNNSPGPGLSSCASSAAPAVCGGWLDGSVVVAAGGTTVTVNTTQVQADSEIFLTEDSSLGTKLGVTCNVTPATALTVTARTPGTSFVITTNAPTTNPRCIHFSIR